jgi:hypothetical protein
MCLAANQAGTKSANSRNFNQLEHFELEVDSFRPSHLLCASIFVFLQLEEAFTNAAFIAIQAQESGFTLTMIDCFTMAVSNRIKLIGLWFQFIQSNDFGVSGGPHVQSVTPLLCFIDALQNGS